MFLCLGSVCVSEPEDSHAASRPKSHHLWSAKQWRTPGICAVSERHGDQHEGELHGLNIVTVNVHRHTQPKSRDSCM